MIIRRSKRFTAGDAAVRRGLTAVLCVLCGLFALTGPARAQNAAPKLVDQAPAVAPAPAVKLPPVQERRLANGLRVIYLENREQPVVALSLMIRSGATAEPPAKAGLAQMTAALLDQGTTTRSAKQIAEAIDSAGGGLSASAGWDATTGSTTVLANRAQLAAELLADVLSNPAFKAEEIERVRTQILSGLQLGRSDAGQVADQVFDKVVYGATPYAHPISGTPETIRSITRDDLVKFHQDYYGPSNATLAIVGDLTAKEAFDLAEKNFGSWPKRELVPAPKPAPPPPAEKVRIVVLDKPDAAQTEIRAGMVGIARTDPDYFSALVTNTILGGAPFSSRIESELRVKRGLTYGAGSRFDARLLGGSFQVETNTKTASTAEAVRVILEQISGLRGGEVTAEELNARKGYLTGVFLLSLETPDAVAGRLLQAELYGLPPDYIETYAKRILAITSADVKRIADTRIVPDHFVIVLAGNAKEFLEQVKAFGPVETIPFDEVDLTSDTLRRAAAPAATAAPVSEADAKAGLAIAQKTVAALGGDAFVNQKSLALKGTGTLSPAPGQSLPIQSLASYDVYPDKSRVDLDIGMAVITQVSSGDAGWLKTPAGVQDVSGQVKEGRLYGIEVLRRVGSGGLTARPLADAEVGGKPAKAFAVSDAAGHETTFYVDPTTSLPVKLAFKTTQGQVEVLLSDYRAVSGVQVPATIQQYRNGAKFLEAAYTDLQVNADVDPKLFEKPQ